MTSPIRLHDPQTLASCVWCIDGHTPAGLHPILGPVYRLCPTRIACDTCADISVYPADFHTPSELANTLLREGLAAVICPGCYGVTAVIGLTNDGGIR